MSKAYETIGQFNIFFEEIYFIAFAGGKRELTKEHQKNWDKTNNLPLLLQVKERRKLGLINDPNVVPVKGRELLSFFRELGFIPMFDRAFNNTRLLQITDAVAYQYIKNKSLKGA
jgi:hypothetical protein